MTPIRRRLLTCAAVALAVVALGAVGLHLAVRQLQAQIEGALGPRASIGAIRAGWTGIDVLELRLKAAPGWPAEDELRAQRVRIEPDLRSLAGGSWRIARVQVQGGYLSVLRTRDGKTRLLPALLERPAAKAGGASPASAPTSAQTLPAIEIAKVELDAARVDFFDASVRQPPLSLHLAALDAQVGPIALPTLDRAMQIKLAGVFKGPQRDGRLAIDGSYTPASSDAEVRARFSGVDLVALQPYLLKVAEAGVRRGALDLDLHATVVRNRLRAPGTLTLTNLELASSGPLGTFAGVPRSAVLAAMTERGRLEVRFTLEGRLDDPSFSLNENLATRIASGMAEGLGVSLSGMVKGMGGVVKGLFGR